MIEPEEEIVYLANFAIGVPVLYRGVLLLLHRGKNFADCLPSLGTEGTLGGSSP